MLTAAHPFGDFIDQIADDHGLKLYELADELGYSQGWIPQVRNGRKPPPYGMVRRICRRFPEYGVHEVFSLVEDARQRLGYDDEGPPGLLGRLMFGASGATSPTLSDLVPA